MSFIGCTLRRQEVEGIPNRVESVWEWEALGLTVVESYGDSRAGDRRCRHPFRLPIYDQASHERFLRDGVRPSARCRWCKSCVRIAEREWVRSIQSEAERWRGYVGYMVLSISTKGRTDGDVYEDLVRCRTLFVKRLRSRYPNHWRHLVWRLEAGENGHFPHLNVLFFGWRYIRKESLHELWSAVTLEVTGTAARADRISAVGWQESGRMGRYVFKEALTGLSRYTWKEGRPIWLPKRRRLWAKSPGSDVSAWPKQRAAAFRPDDSSRGQPVLDGSRSPGLREALGLAMTPARLHLADDLSPPGQLSLSL